MSTAANESNSSSSTKKRCILGNGRIIGGFFIDDYIGHGGYSDIYSAQDSKTRKFYALKIEEKTHDKITLENEMEFYEMVKGNRFFPVIHKVGEVDRFRYIAMELLGPSLSACRRIFPEEKFTLQTVLRVARQTLLAIQSLHKFGLVHRDIKPANFLIRADNLNPIVLSDLGLCRQYLDPEGQHVKPRPPSGFTGVVKYASINAHKKQDLSRRDDLISWVYSMVELVDGKLPWSGLNDRDVVMQMKDKITPQSLCNSFPEEFKKIYMYVLTLEFEDAPDYDKILELLNKASIKSKVEGKDYDWCALTEDQISKISKVPIVARRYDKPQLKLKSPLPQYIVKRQSLDEEIVPPISGGNNDTGGSMHTTQKVHIHTLFNNSLNSNRRGRRGIKVEDDEYDPQDDDYKNISRKPGVTRRRVKKLEPDEYDDWHA